MALDILKYEVGEFPSQIAHIRVSSDILTLDFGGSVSNIEPNGDVTLPITVYASADRAKAGIHARLFYVAEVDGQGFQLPQGKKFIVPILRLTVYRRVFIGTIGQYDGTSVIVLGKRGESFGS